MIHLDATYVRLEPYKCMIVGLFVLHTMMAVVMVVVIWRDMTHLLLGDTGDASGRFRLCVIPRIGTLGEG